MLMWAAGTAACEVWEQWTVLPTAWCLLTITTGGGRGGLARKPGSDGNKLGSFTVIDGRTELL